MALRVPYFYEKRAKFYRLVIKCNNFVTYTFYNQVNPTMG